LGIYYQSADFFSFLYQLRGILLKFSLFGAIFMPVCSAEYQGHLVTLKKVCHFGTAFVLQRPLWNCCQSTLRWCWNGFSTVEGVAYAKPAAL